MPRLLLINPNTSTFTTSLLMEHARKVLPDELEIVGATGAFGAAAIVSEADYAIAAKAALQAYWAHPGPWSAVLLACFGDPGSDALTRVSGVPVVSFADAAMTEAARFVGHGGRFAVVTGGLHWETILTRIATGLGYAATFAGVFGIDSDGEAIARDPAKSLDALHHAVTRAVKVSKANAVIIGGAGLAGLAAQLQPYSPVPLIDSALVGMRAAGNLALFGHGVHPTD
jgi:Asp/Glu/hydantoin racemase